MAKLMYCWRCDMEIPMLDEAEWNRVGPHLSNKIEEIKRYRTQHGVSLREALDRDFGHEALRVYEQLTGFKESNPNALYHHRIDLYGVPCENCGKPLRTPSARICAACGATV